MKMHTQESKFSEKDIPDLTGYVIIVTGGTDPDPLKNAFDNSLIIVTQGTLALDMRRLGNLLFTMPAYTSLAAPRSEWTRLSNR